MRVIKPAWKNSLASKRRIAPATNKINYSITKKY